VAGFPVGRLSERADTLPLYGSPTSHLVVSCTCLWGDWTDHTPAKHLHYTTSATSCQELSFRDAATHQTLPSRLMISCACFIANIQSRFLVSGSEKFNSGRWSMMDETMCPTVRVGSQSSTRRSFFPEMS